MQLQYLFPKGFKSNFVFLGVYSLGWIFALLLFSACGVKVPPDTIDVVVKDIHTDTPIENARVQLYPDPSGKYTKTTDKLGYANFNLKKYAGKNLEENISNISLKWAAPKSGEGSDLDPIDESVQLNKYIHFYNLYLDGDPNATSKRDTNKVADMHFHISMRMQNLFGQDLYERIKPAPLIPPDLDWYRDYRKLNVMCSNGKMLCHFLDSVSRKEALAALISQKWTYSKGGSNLLTQHSQATLPHMMEGNVMLAFNAISPWEFKLSDDPTKRLGNQLFVSGARQAWLNMIGDWKHDTLTHWENFNKEYNMITCQNNYFNHFEWRFYHFNDDLKDGCPTVINVAEGSHMLQDTFFPHSFSARDFISNKVHAIYDRKQLKRIVDIRIRNFNESDSSLLEYENYLKASNLFEDNSNLIQKAKDVTTSEVWKNVIYLERHLPYDSLGFKMLTKKEKPEDVTEKNVIELVSDITGMDTIQAFITKIWMHELTSNIYSLKHLEGPPICMMNIAHLVYNGMIGHAPNMDQGKALTHIAAKKNYDIRVSDDRSYTNQWEKLFYVVPGVNAYGKAVIDSLLSWENGHRIYVDLKHSDVSTRKYFFDNVMIHTNKDGEQDTIPPICSHCAVTGLPLEYYSPFVNEYSLINSTFTRTFYPFAINIYNDEITKICTHNGIIGIPLEQRALGGYLNNKRTYDYFLKKNGDEGTKYSYMNIFKKKGTKGKKLDKQFIKRWTMVDRWLTRYVLFRDSISQYKVIDAAYNYTINNMGVQEKELNKKINENEKNEKKVRKEKYKMIKPVMEALCRDYQSVEPFLQNVFHVIDHSGLDPKEAWKHICIGSDLDGMIDPIDICPTASQYPLFKERVKQFIPVFLLMRPKMVSGNMDTKHDYRKFEDYFPSGPHDPTNPELITAMNYLFYYSLRDFADKYFKEHKEEIP